MAARSIVLVGAPRLTIEDVEALATRRASPQLHRDAPARLQRCYEFMQRAVVANIPIYGLTTGCGPLASNAIAPEYREQFQRNLVRSHACALGPAHSASFVRAAMSVRAHTLALGYSGVAPATVELLVAMLARDIHPIVREIGGVGASGDLVELAQLALALMGEGTVEVDGRPLAAADALRGAGLVPLVPRYREGLAVMNGTSFHSGVAAVLAARSHRILAAAQVAAAMLLEALRANSEAIDPALENARPHPGHQVIAARLRQLMRDSALLRRDGSAAGRQDAYTLRCVPQVLGAALDGLRAASEVIEVEINAVTDNPLFLADEERVVHGGNFHGQPGAMAIDQLKSAMTTVGVMCERRIARVLDPSLNDELPPFLIRVGVGLHNGFMGLQYCATTMAAENSALVAPASVRSIPTNANNQDMVSMAMLAARHAARVVDNVERMIAIELLCAAQALDLRGAAQAGVGTRAAHALVRAHSAPLTADRPLQEDVETVVALIGSGAITDVIGD